ncbi:K(+)-transporting ATPase subunit F [Sodalis glossinidius]|uniref:K(+)-transporting ATPase subunit F n=1 Tax=Sodalis glossinidius TaxID=63612 RepID=UPI0002F1EE72|nr:K(+)-transporting ATPase subunit F [Sodalis glossinidius]
MLTPFPFVFADFITLAFPPYYAFVGVWLNAACFSCRVTGGKDTTFLYTRPGNIDDIFILIFLDFSSRQLIWRIAVNIGVIAGIVLVFLLLAYLFYALFRAEEF